MRLAQAQAGAGSLKDGADQLQAGSFWVTDRLEYLLRIQKTAML